MGDGRWGGEENEGKEMKMMKERRWEVRIRREKADEEENWEWIWHKEGEKWQKINLRKTGIKRKKMRNKIKDKTLKWKYRESKKG